MIDDVRILADEEQPGPDNADRLSTQEINSGQEINAPVASVPVSRRRFPKASWITLTWLSVLWVLFWGDLTWGNVLGGLLVALVVTTIVPLPRSVSNRRLTVRPIAFLRLAGRFAYDIVLASLQITWEILKRKQPPGAIIKVQLRAHSDSFMAATAAMTALVPGSFVVNLHRLTGVMYVHIFDIEYSGGAEGAKQSILEQEERLLRALGTKEELLDAGYVPGGSTKLGRLEDQEAAK